MTVARQTHGSVRARLAMIAASLGLLMIFGQGAASLAGEGGLTDSLQRNRDRLLADWAERKGYGGDVCRAWGDLSPSAQGAFLTITHRLQITRVVQTGRPALDHITALYSIRGAKGSSCGGMDYNRLF